MENSERFRQELAKQLNFIESSCESYDQGNIVEAIRIAVPARVIFHHTNRSASLLSHLQATTINMLSENVDVEDMERMLPSGMKITGAAFTGGTMYSCERGIVPVLGQGPFSRVIPLDYWWSECIAIMDGHRFSRKDLVLAAANKDGGAHVDEKLPEWYESLLIRFRQVTVDAESGQETSRSGFEQYPMLRQLGYEILNSQELVTLCQK